MIKKLIFLSFISLMLLSGVQADQEIITGFEKKDVPVVNEELRKLKETDEATQAEVDAINSVPVGSLFLWAASAVPTGYLECNGSAVSRTTYSGLFAVIGTTWGAGDGSTTFNVPDLRGRAPIGAGTGSGLTARTLAATGGNETHTLTVDEMPAHTHDIRSIIGGGASSSGHNFASNNLRENRPTESTGGGQAHNNMMPFIVTKFIIKT